MYVKNPITPGFLQLSMLALAGRVLTRNGHAWTSDNGRAGHAASSTSIPKRLAPPPPDLRGVQDSLFRLRSNIEHRLQPRQRWTMKNLFASGLTAFALATVASLAAVTPAEAVTVATISGCYDCGVFDTPSLIFNNTTGGTLTSAQMVLNGFQGQNNGLAATVDLGTLSAGSTQFFWGTLPGVPSGTTPGNLTAYDYDDQYINTSAIINDPTCGGAGCAAGGGPQWYAQVGNFSVTFTALVSGGTFNGQSVFSVFSPVTNATGSFVGWEGLDPNGFSESPAWDVHTGIVTGDLANIDLGVPPPVPEPESYALMLAGFAAMGFVARRRKVAGARKAH